MTRGSIDKSLDKGPTEGSEGMIDKLRDVVRKVKADFVDIRHEVREDTTISFQSAELREIGTNRTDGYVVRVLRDGGFGTASVTRFEDLGTALGRAEDSAETMARSGAAPVKMAGCPSVIEDVMPELNEDPFQTPLGEKLSLLKGYNDIALGEPEIASTTLSYSEVGREKCYVSSEGSAITERLVTTGISGSIVAQRGTLTQDIRVSVGGSDGFAGIRNRDDVFLRRARIAGKLLDAKPVESGSYDVILNPLLTGVFTHEAFGHFSEADLIEKNPTLRDKMKLGSKLGSDVVSIYADSTMPHQLGFYKYDDEGVAVQPVALMERGILTGRLHSRRTAAAFEEEITGHGVAEDFRFAPIIRMGTIYVGAGDQSFEDLLSDLGDGLYLLDGKGGQTSGENFTFGAQYGYIVKGGRVGPMVRDINIMGNLFTTLQDIKAVGDTVELSERGGCGKGQLNIKSCLGGPHVVIRNMVVGGI